MAIYFLFNVSFRSYIIYNFFNFLKEEWNEAKEEKFDFSGSALYFIGLSEFLYALMSLFETNIAKYLLIITFLILIGFIIYEAKQKYPTLNVKLFSKNMTFTFSNLAAFIHYSATFAVIFIIAIYLQVVFKLDSSLAGIIMLVQPILMTVLSPFTGRLSDRIEPRLMASTGMMVTTIGLFLFCFLGEQTSLWMIVINLPLIGVGFAFFSSPNTNSVMSSVEPKYMGVAFSPLL